MLHSSANRLLSFQWLLCCILAGLLFIACESEKDAMTTKTITTAAINYRDTIIETDSTLEIGKACAVYFAPTDAQLDIMKREVGEDDFYTIMDDYAWYQAESSTFLEDKKLTIVQAEKKKIRIHQTDGQLREYSPADTSITWNIVLFDGKKTVAQSPAIGIEDTYKKLFD